MRRLVLNIGILTLGLGQAACSMLSSTSSSMSSGDTTKAVSAKSTGSGDAVSGQKDINTQVKSQSNLFKGVEGFLVKDSERLRASINECLDAGLLVVRAEMKAIPTAQAAAMTAAGRKVILPQNFANSAPNAGPDVIEQLADDLYNPLKVSRSETSAGTLSLNYLGALATVADVVAWNCDFANPAARCNCASPDGAKKILQRCVPAYTDEQIADVAGKFAASCAASKTMDEKRQALAAFISSATFAEAR